MRTTKPISTISYNSDSFLLGKLKELEKAKVIGFWAYIKHKPEMDETKEHIHLLCCPCRMLVTEDLQEQFKEFDVNNPSKPLGVIMWRNSKIKDWILYVLHDEEYLRKKGLVRKYHYNIDDIVTNDKETLLQFYRECKEISGDYMKIISAVSNGVTFDEFLMTGCVPIQLIRQYQIAFDTIKLYYEKQDEEI